MFFAALVKAPKSFTIRKTLTFSTPYKSFSELIQNQLTTPIIIWNLLCKSLCNLCGMSCHVWGNRETIIALEKLSAMGHQNFPLFSFAKHF